MQWHGCGSSRKYLRWSVASSVRACMRVADVPDMARWQSWCTKCFPWLEVPHQPRAVALGNLPRPASLAPQGSCRAHNGRQPHKLAQFRHAPLAVPLAVKPPITGQQQVARLRTWEAASLSAQR